MEDDKSLQIGALYSGRYQVVAAGGWAPTPVLVDTETGRTWMLDRGRWSSIPFTQDGGYAAPKGAIPQGYNPA
jgi:hypothetical protein